MNRTAIILFVFVFQITCSFGLTTGNKSNWNPELNTAGRAHYLSGIEKEVILEMNKLRSNPSKYADEYIVPLKDRYKKNHLFYPGDKPLLTKEGVKALNECIRDLKKQQSLPLLFPDEGLSKAAGDHVHDQSQSGKTGHMGRDRSRVKERIERYGTWKVRIAENIAYGGINARQIVIYLLIDDGIQSRGHRKNFLHPDYKRVGVAVGRHPHYQSMCVIDFAGAFVMH
ncbi:MAG: CAP domain-containing protein [Prolixibacteraceae bacterium]